MNFFIFAISLFVLLSKKFVYFLIQELIIFWIPDLRGAEFTFNQPISLVVIKSSILCFMVNRYEIFSSNLSRDGFLTYIPTKILFAIHW